MGSVCFVQRRPAPPLDSFIESLWLWDSGPRQFALERVLPTGCAQIIVNLKEDRTRLYSETNGSLPQVFPGTVVTGLSSRYQIIDTHEQEHVLGVSFRPGGLAPFFRMPAHELSGSDVPLEALWGAAGVSRLREQLLEAAGSEGKLAVMERVLGEAFRGRDIHPVVSFALGAIGRKPVVPSLAAIVQSTGLSQKRFIERFKADVGLTPKRYCRILRFQKAVALAHAAECVDWSGLALDCGYFDQAHFIHDFRAFAGVTPAAYLASRTEFQNHVNFLQS